MTLIYTHRSQPLTFSKTLDAEGLRWAFGSADRAALRLGYTVIDGIYHCRRA